jgi:hypothetical protein
MNKDIGYLVENIGIIPTKVITLAIKKELRRCDTNRGHWSETAEPSTYWPVMYSEEIYYIDEQGEFYYTAFDGSWQIWRESRD